MTPRFVVESARLAGPPLLKAQTDDRLVDLVRAGNDRAFEAIVERYRRPLLRYCARLLPLSRAEDAVQQAFLNAYGGMRDSDAELDLRPWLYRIARNACLNALRENGWSHEQIEHVRGGGESAHDAVERRQELRAVVAAVHMLPERQREAVVLRELEGRSYDQIAIQLDASDGAVRQLLNRARNTLRAGATAVTPLGLLTRPWSPTTHRVATHASEAAGHGLVSGLARAAGVAAMSMALVVGASETSRVLGGPQAPLPGDGIGHVAAASLPAEGSNVTGAIYAAGPAISSPFASPVTFAGPDTGQRPAPPEAASTDASGARATPAGSRTSPALSTRGATVQPAVIVGAPAVSSPGLGLADPSSPVLDEVLAAVGGQTVDVVQTVEGVLTATLGRQDRPNRSGKRGSRSPTKDSPQLPAAITPAIPPASDGADPTGDAQAPQGASVNAGEAFDQARRGDGDRGAQGESGSDGAGDGPATRQQADAPPGRRSKGSGPRGGR